MDLREARSQIQRRPATRVSPGDYFAFDGGLNLVDTPLKIDPGELLAAFNYELGVRGGYRRIGGYERVDGRLKASEALYYLVTYENGTGSYPAVGSTVTTATGTGVLLQALSSPTGTMVLGRVTGTFAAAQAIQFSAVTFATATSAAGTSADTDTLDTAYSVLAREDQRTLIQKVPGAGSVLGVVTYHGVIYAWRNASDNLSAAMWKATAGGWSSVPLGTKVRFNAGGTGEILAGSVVIGQTSGATGTVRRVVVTSGTWAGADAAGYMIIPALTGTFTGTENIRVGGVTFAHFVSQAAQTLAPNGRYEFRIHNFYGHTATERVYGVDGQNYAFEFQDGAGSFFLQIETGMAIDKPAHLEVGFQRLLMTFQGGSLQWSGTADPALITPATGAAEVGVGQEITSLLMQVSGTLFIFCTGRTDTLAGTGPADWVLKPFSETGGAQEWSVQDLVGGTYLDTNGFTTLSATQKFGNFQSSSVSSQIEPLTRGIANQTVSSVLVRSRNLYRLFLADGRFITMGTRDNKITGFTPGAYRTAMRCAWCGEDADDQEQIVLGGADGYVYQAESGTSFDGEPVVAFLRPAFHHNRSPGRIKRYRRAQFDVKPARYTSFTVSVIYSYGRPDVQGDPAVQLMLTGGGVPQWDVSRWDDYLGADSISSGSMKLDGSGTNIGFFISTMSATEEPHSIEGVILHESLRRIERGL